MNRRLMTVALLVGLAVGPSHAHSQEATERFIPIGQSPGQSGKTTYIGSVDAVDARARTLTVSAPGGARRVTVTERTSIWLDRSRAQQSAGQGSFADLQAGRRVEIKWNSKNPDVADWIKVESP